MTPLNSIYGVDSDFFKKKTCWIWQNFKGYQTVVVLFGRVVSKMVPIFSIQSSGAL